MYMQAQYIGRQTLKFMRAQAKWEARLAKNISSKQNIEGERWYKLMKTWAFLNYWGLAPGLPPKSLRLWVQVYANVCKWGHLANACKTKEHYNRPRPWGLHRSIGSFGN